MSSSILGPLNYDRAQAKRKRDDGIDTDAELTNNRPSVSSSGALVPYNAGSKFKHLRIEIPSKDLTGASSTVLNISPSLFSASSPALSACSDANSLFSEKSLSERLNPAVDPSPPYQRNSLPIPALTTAPPIPGLFFTPSLQIPQELANEVTAYCLETYFRTPNVNQIMLFGRLWAPEPLSDTPSPTYHTVSMLKVTSGFPPILESLLTTLSGLLLPVLPPQIYELLFPLVPIRARQAILNLYNPGEGITPHVDLLKRFGDGIIGVSFGSGCVMQFEEAEDEKVSGEGEGLGGSLAQVQGRKRWDLYLPERSVVVLTGDARYRWTHGIGRHTEDYVCLDGGGSSGRWIQRGVRLSITFRWLLPGADVVGGDETTSLSYEHVEGEA